MIRLRSFMNGSPIYVPADVVIKENYEYEFEMNHALPTSKYKQLGGAMVVYGGVEYSVKESPEEVARKVLEWRLAMERYRAYANSAAFDEKPQANECWELAANARAELARLAGLEEPTMTRDEILAMEPGRELDARIAHLVMGWHVTSCETYPHEKIVRVKTLRSPEESGGEVPYEKTFTKVYSSAIWNKDIPHYSTDISAAWEVVERMTSLFWEMNLDTGSKSNTTKVEFYRTFDQEFHVVVANTAPEAICKAALLAVMGGEKDDQTTNA